MSKRIIAEIKSLKVTNTDISYQLSINGETNSGPYVDPELRAADPNADKSTLKEAIFDFYADGSNAIFQALSPIFLEMELSKSDYPALEKITIRSGFNEMSEKV